MGTTRRFLRNMDKVTLSNLGKAATLQKVVSTVTAMGFGCSRWRRWLRQL